MTTRVSSMWAALIWAVLIAAPSVFPGTAEGQTMPPRKLELDKFSCRDLLALQSGEYRDRVLIYFNGYLDGTKKATHWDAEIVGKRVDEVMRLCAANSNLKLIDAFKQAWTRR